MKAFALSNIPQISPMNWLLLLMLFIFLFYMAWVKIYFIK